ncbi:MAG: hypothetical protein GX654_04230 [Desulfatiglans sp.]|nr:hypothetical protein [Desulfatiglans sp.]
MKRLSIYFILMLFVVSIIMAGSATAQDSKVEVKACCNRAMLQAAVDSYLATQSSGDITKMALATSVKYMENMEPIAKEKGLWHTALPIAFSRSYLDPDICKSFTEVIVTEGGHPYVIGTRLTVEYGKISEIDSLVTDKDDWLFDAEKYLKYSKIEDWSVLPPEKRSSRSFLIQAGNSYLDIFFDKSVIVPWGKPCARLEGGAYTLEPFPGMPAPKEEPGCDIGIPDNVPIVGRSYLVDEELGVVNIFCRFGDALTGMPDSHTFRLVDGKMRYVHTLSVSPPGGMQMPMPKSIPLNNDKPKVEGK